MPRTEREALLMAVRESLTTEGAPVIYVQGRAGVVKWNLPAGEATWLLRALDEQILEERLRPQGVEFIYPETGEVIC